VDSLHPIMATVMTREQADPQLVAEKSRSVEPRRISIDTNFVAIAGLLALALAAFAYLNSRIDSLSGRIDGVAAELRTEIKRSSERTDDKIEKLSAEMKRNSERADEKIEKLSEEMKRSAERADEKIEKLSAEMKRSSERTDDKLDKLTDKLNALLLNQSQGK